MCLLLFDRLFVMCVFLCALCFAVVVFLCVSPRPRRCSLAAVAAELQNQNPEREGFDLEPKWLRGVIALCVFFVVCVSCCVCFVYYLTSVLFVLCLCCVICFIVLF